MGKEKVISLACVSSETHTMQRVFRPRGVLPYIGYIGMCGAKGFWSEIGYQFRPFWSEIRYGLCTLVLNWVYL